MGQFNFGPALIPADARRVYRIPLLGAELELAPMTKANKAYWSELLSLVAARRAAGGQEPIDEATIARGRQRDAELMAKHVLVGWKGVADRDGTSVPFALSAARDFLRELATTEGAEHLFDDIRAFAQNEDNFTASGIAAARAYAGN